MPFVLFCSPPSASYSEGINPHEYNAHFIDAYFSPKLFVVADGPQEKNTNKFWQMVWDQDCAYIIMLTPLDAEVVRIYPWNLLIPHSECFMWCIWFH